MIANIIMALVATGIFAFSLMITVPSMFGALDAERVAAQAMQYAEIEANIIKLLNYDDIDNSSVLAAANIHTTRQNMTAVSASNWEDEVLVGDEEVLDGENKYRIATINIYQSGDTIPRASLEVPLSSQGSSGANSTSFGTYTTLVDGGSSYKNITMSYTPEKDGFLILSQVAWAQKTVKVIDSTTGIELNTSESGDDDANSFCLPLIKGHTYDISCVVRYIYFLPFA